MCCTFMKCLTHCNKTVQGALVHSPVSSFMMSEDTLVHHATLEKCKSVFLMKESLTRGGSALLKK